MKGERSSEIQAPAAIWHGRRTEQYVEEANCEDVCRFLLISSCNRSIMNNAGLKLRRHRQRIRDYHRTASIPG